MSSISPQAVVERASAEISKRINGLGLRTKHHHANNAATAAAAAATATAATTTTTTPCATSVTSSTVSATPATTTLVSGSILTTTTTTGTVTASTTTTTTNNSKSSSVMERVTHVLCGGNFNQNSSSNNQSSKNNSLSNLNVVVMADKQARNTSSPSLATSPSNIVIGNTNTVTGNSNYQLQTQIAGSTLVQSNLAPTPTALGLTAIGAPPAPTVTSIAKQMNIPLPGNLAASTITSTNLKSNARKTIIAHHPYAAPGAQCVSPSGGNNNSTQQQQHKQQQQQQQQQHNLSVAQTQAIKVYNQGTAVKTITALMLEERFLNNFFLYFNATERRVLAQVCIKWRDILYRTPRFWFGLMPVLPCRELRQLSSNERMKIYNSIIRRGFRALTLVGTSDEDALDIVHSFPLATKHVHSLTLRCSSISDRGLEALLDHLQSLFELELSGCNEVTEAGLWACLTPRIVSLSLNDCINIADEAIGAVAQLLPSLYEFSLQAYHVTDAALGYFSPKQSHSLSILRLQSCWELTNHGIVNIVHSLPHLTVLSLSGCSKLTDDGVELIAENLQKLRALDLSWCPRVTDASLEYIACDLNHLEELTLDRCIHITDIGVGYISTMLTLTTLFLRWCSQVRDFGLQHLCSMRNLQVLSLAGCPLLTSSGLSSLIQLRHLQELELTNCPGASHELFEYLKEHLPHCLIIE